jgi:hypothetical protein
MKSIYIGLWAILIVSLFSQCEKSNQSANITQTIGKAGSLSRFALVGNYLYAINNQKLMVYSAADPKNLSLLNTLNVGESIETIFPFQDKLFIASNNGMYMYSLANPIAPIKESFVQHITGCDPVVANETHAYLTIHSGRNCGSNNINVLQVYKLDTNLANPTFKTNIPLSNPIGLGLKDKYLFVCDKVQGLIVFDITNGDLPVEKQIITGETFVDVIVYNGLLICMLENGIAYYDIADIDDIKKLSVLN